MNKKTKTYLLLVAVLGVWGTIGYKMINGLSSEIPKMSSQTFDNSFKPKKIAKVESFTIEDANRDPFLGTLIGNKKKNPLKIVNTNIQKTVENNPIISYGGLVKKQNAKNQVFVLNINNKQYLLKKGQIVDSVRLISGNAKQIVIRYNKKLQTLNRQ